MLGERAITMAYRTRYVSHRDPAIDWDRVVTREYELQPGLGEKVKTEVEARLALEPSVTPADMRRVVEKEHVAARIGPRIRINPAITLETYVPKHGESVTIFDLGVLQPAVAARIDDETSGLGTGVLRYNERYWRCFLEGVRSIENLSANDGKIPTRTVEGELFVDQVWLRSRFVGLRELAQEVGFAIWAMNRFTEDDAKK